ncbi:radical SAM protein [bacterium]|nr:radical SAM protein [bacterium]
MKDNQTDERLGILLLYPDDKRAALGSPGFRQVFRTFSCADDVTVDWGWYDERTGRVILECRTWEKQCYNVVALSVPFELLYGNAVRILSALNLEPEKEKRKLNDPVVVIGGAAPTINPSVARVLADIVCIGEAEAFFSELLRILQSYRFSGAARRLTPMTGTPVPENVQVAPDISLPPESIDSSMLDGFDDPALCAFEDAGLVEVGRGCSRGCRFCAAGHIYLPVRHRAVDDVLRDARTYKGKAGRIGLVGASVSDHRHLKEIFRGLLDLGFGLTTSSFRADMIDDELVGLLAAGGLRTVTIAPEGGSERIRRIINKNLTEDRILDAVKTCNRAGIRGLKLYYMVGLPWECRSDITAIIDLTAKIHSIFRGPGKKITVSVNPFIPKPQTPFQWCGMAEPGYIEKVYRTLKRGFLKMSGLSFKPMSVRTAVREAVISLGDGAVGKALVETVRDEVPWKKALVRHGIDINRLVHSDKPPEIIFPWDDITGEKRKAALRASYEKAQLTAQDVQET